MTFFPWKALLPYLGSEDADHGQPQTREVRIRRMRSMVECYQGQGPRTECMSKLILLMKVMKL